MKRQTLIFAWAVFLMILPRPILAQLEFQPVEAQQSFFPGDARPVAVRFHNPADQPVEVALRTQLYQTSSATVIPLGEPREWKQIHMLPGQTVLESTPVNFPTVKAGSRFLVQWLDDKKKLVGKADIMIYPTNLLRALKPLAGKEPLGVYDPQNKLKPLLKTLEVPFINLAEGGLDGFSGKLAVIGPFESKTQIFEEMPGQIKALAKNGAAIVWIQPPPERWAKVQPSFYSVPEKEIAVVVVQANLVANLSENPQAQLNLLHFCQLALQPESPSLPLPKNSN